MKIRLNGKELESSSANLLELSYELSLPQQGVAIAINNRMIPRAAWANTKLEEEASIVIIKAACGG